MTSMAGATEDVANVAEALRMLQNDLQCGICLEVLHQPVTTRCRHTFCRLCIDRIFSSLKAVCPLCNATVNRRGIVANDQLERLAKAASEVIAAAQKDIEDTTFGDILLFERKNKSSTREALSPSGHVGVGESTSAPPKSTLVETWLSEMPLTSLTQESSPSVHVDSSPNEESDGEMVSVSQFNPKQRGRQVELHMKEKHPSGHIEDDRDGDELSQEKNTTLKKAGLKTHPPKQNRQLKAKGNKEMSKSILGETNPLTKSSLRASREETWGGPVAVPEPVVVVLGKEKENVSHPIRSPGWSRVLKMKKEFHQPIKANVKESVSGNGDQSPVPSIEDAVSGDEDGPCLSLCLDSPVLKKKAKINEIVNNLEYEIQIFEKSGQTFSNLNNKECQKVPEKLKIIEKKQENSSLRDDRNSRSRTLVQFLKLGSLIPTKHPLVPFFLRGCLEHLSLNSSVLSCCKLFVDAQTQTTCQVACPSPAVSMEIDGDILPETGRTKSSKRSEEMFADIMDAETVLLSQCPAVKETSILRKGCRNSEDMISDVKDGEADHLTQSPFKINPTSDEKDASNSPKNVEVETELCTQALLEDLVGSQESDSCILLPEHLSKTKHHDFEGFDGFEPQSQKSESIIFSQNTSNKSPAKKFKLKKAANPLVDSDDSSSSEVVEKKSKRVRTSRCSNSSSDSDESFATNLVQKRRKNKATILSDNEESSPSFLDISLPDPELQAKIKADIKAKLDDAERREQSSHWHDGELEKNMRTVPEASCVNIQEINDDHLNTPDVGKSQGDSDCESEFINPTPQKKEAYLSRNATQSSDIVPSSQPPLADYKSMSRRTIRDSVDIGDPESIGQDKTSETANPVSSDTSPLSNKAPLLETVGENKETSFAHSVLAAKPSFVCSNLPNQSVALVQKLAAIVGGEFSTKFNAETTHLIVKVDDENRADKTLKYLSSIAAGKWVVSLQWVQKCLQANKMVPEEPFEALDTSGEPGPRRSREARAVGKKLFKNFEFCCIGSFPDLSKEELKALLLTCGASVVDKPTDFSFQDHIVPVSLAQWEESKDDEYTSWLDRYSCPLVQHEWVLDCIGKFCVTSFSSMLLCDASDDFLFKMGIPPYLYECLESE